MPSKDHPENLKDVKSVVGDDIEEFVSSLSRDIEEECDNRKLWEQAVDRLNRKRFGARKKKHHPWPGAANYVIPVIDSKIEKIKPSYVNLAFGVSPIVTFEPYGPEDVEPARKREMLFDWRMRTQVKFFKPYCYGVDKILGAAGQAVFRIIWKFSSRNYNLNFNLEDFDPQVVDALYDARVTDEMLERIIVETHDIDMSYEENEEEVGKAVKRFRDGETQFDLNLLETKEDQPEVVACDVSQDLIIPIDTKDLNDARFIDYKYWVTKNELKISIQDGKYNDFNDDDINSWSGKQTQDNKKGKIRTVSAQDDMVLLHETCCWYDVDNDGIEERCIVTWPDSDPSKILRFIGLPYDHGMWPYVQVKRELIDDYFYSTRGLPSLDEDFQTGISTAVNQAIDNGTLLNQPERVAKRGVLSNPRNRRFLPGELTEINGQLSDYETRVHGNASQGILFQQAQYLKGWSDERVGDHSVQSSPTELPGLGQGGKKTKAEIVAIGQERSQSQSLDLQIFQQQMALVYYQIDALYNQFGSDEESILITGQAPRRISRDEIQGKFDIVPNGRLDNSTPHARLQKKMIAFQIGQGNPMVKQDILIREIFEDIDPRLADILLKSDEEMNEELAKNIQDQQRLEQEQLQKQIGVRKVSDDLDVRKEILLTPIQGRKFAPD